MTMETPQEMKARHARERRSARRLAKAWVRFETVADAQLTPDEVRVFVAERMADRDAEHEA